MSAKFLQLLHFKYSPVSHNIISSVSIEDKVHSNYNQISDLLINKRLKYMQLYIIIFFYYIYNIYNMLYFYIIYKLYINI